MTKRWLMLVLGCIAQLGGYMSMNFPSYMYLQILQIFDIDSIEFNVLYTVISFPNIFMPFLMGVVSQKYLNARKMFLLTVTLTFIGHTLCTISLFTKQFPLLIIGRGLVGIGDTNVHVPRNEIVTKWFINNDLAFAFSCFSSIGRGGIFVVAYIFTFYQEVALDIMYQPLLIINLVCFVAFLCANLFVYIDAFHDQETQEFQEEQSTEHGEGSGQISGEENSDGSNSSIQWSKLPLIFWTIIILACVGYGMFFPYTNNIQLILHQKYELKGKFTVLVQMIPMIMSLGLSPITGLIVDKKGKIPLFFLVAGLIAFCAYFISLCNPGLFFENAKIESILPLVLLGLYFSIFPVVQDPSISLVLPQKMVGLGVGICMSSINFMQVFFAMFTGYLLKLDSKGGYFDASLLFIAASTLFVIVCVALYFLDQKNNSVLYYCSKQGKQNGQDPVPEISQHQLSQNQLQDNVKKINSAKSSKKQSLHNIV